MAFSKEAAMFVYVGTAILNTEMLRICKKKIFAYFQRNVGLFYGHLLASTNTPPPCKTSSYAPAPHTAGCWRRATNKHTQHTDTHSPPPSPVSPPTVMAQLIPRKNSQFHAWKWQQSVYILNRRPSSPSSWRPARWVWRLAPSGDVILNKSDVKKRGMMADYNPNWMTYRGVFVERNINL